MELAEENTEEFYSFIRFTRRNKMRIQENVPLLPLKKLQRRKTDGKLKDESLSLFALDVFPAELFFFFFFLFHETRYPDREKKRRRKNKRGKEQNRK